MNPALYIAASVGGCALGIASYVIYYAFKYGQNAASPVESWVVARFHRKRLDTELAKILGSTESR